jgi:hypothetical protein
MKRPSINHQLSNLCWSEMINHAINNQVNKYINSIPPLKTLLIINEANNLPCVSPIFS